MAAVVVTYEDGTKETLQQRPVGLVAAERHWKGDLPAIEGGLYAAWYTSTHRDIPFDDWLASLVDVDEPEAPAARQPDPTEPPPPDE